MWTNITKSFVLLGRVREDMDEPTGKLMGAHGYCTQVMPLTIYSYKTNYLPVLLLTIFLIRRFFFKH